MNKQPASLLPANYARSEPNSLGINQYETRAGNPYLSGKSIVSYISGLFGVPYWMNGIAVQTCNKGYITAPEATVKSGSTYMFNTLAPGHVANPFGSAPTAGIYTGVEDHCS